MPMRGDVESSVGLLDRPPRVRPADAEDSAFLAKVILTASRGHLRIGFWDLVVAGSEGDRLDFIELLTLAEPRSFCHYSNFLVAEKDGEPAAAMAGYDPGDENLLAPGHAIAAVSDEFGLSDADLADAYRRLEPYQTALPEQRKGVWTIEWVWTAPRIRRRGLSTMLIERILGRGKQRGYRLAQVTTLLQNEAAALAYEKAGFKVAEEKRHPDFKRLMGAPGFVRYERDLSGNLVQ